VKGGGGEGKNEYSIFLSLPKPHHHALYDDDDDDDDNDVSLKSNF
jgi:hypothetical protein